MRYFLLMIAVVALVGCGTINDVGRHLWNGDSTHWINNTPNKPFINTLGMKFVHVPGTQVQFCIWETRVKDYVVYAAANKGVDVEWKSPGFKQEDTHPVVNVRWDEAEAFCAWLTKKELTTGQLKKGQRYRLPTDAEWSVAVGLGKEPGNTPAEKQGKSNDVYPWGKGWPPPKRAGNFREDMNVDNYKYTSPVGSFAANPHGIYDLGGNVWEWCEDKFTPTSPQGERVLRGNSWHGNPPDIGYSGYHPSSYRNYRSFRRTYFGFRCVLAHGPRP